MTIFKYKTRIYKIWCGIRGRCRNKKGRKAHLYVNKGIKVCSEWENFDVFKDWAYSNGFKDEIVNKTNIMNCLSLDRIDSNKGYQPDNCRWIPLRKNSTNVLSIRKDKINSMLDNQFRLLCMVGNDYY